MVVTMGGTKFSMIKAGLRITQYGKPCALTISITAALLFQYSGSQHPSSQPTKFW